MLNTFTKYLLNFIKSKGVDEFLVIELKEIISNYQAQIDESEVITSFETLNNLGYIILKYNDGNLFCVKLTQKGKSFEDNQFFYPQNNKGNFKNFGWVIFSSFIGSFLGSVILLVFILFIKG